MNDREKEALLASFAAFLDEAPPPAPPAAGQEDDYSLMAQLVALKTEVKTEARQFREALDQFRDLLATLQAGHVTLAAELDRRRADEKKRERELLRPLLVQLLDLYDRLQAGLAAAAKSSPRRRWLGLGCRRDQALQEAIREGQALTLRRLEDLLHEQGVRPLPAAGLPLDPHTMRVTETCARPDLPDGVVVAELRRGFLWGDALLRAAEVQVNRATAEPETAAKP
ncbi:MAG: nucleotide exchange factor GrpE [Thermodesulfobacteriota bacterium]